ncbi:MAG: LysM peptidoglycan-binding domain-containing protein, partial [Coraliomargarita sp.]
RTGQELVIPEAAVSASASPVAASGATHTVQAGEYPGTIARRYGMTASELMELNGISDPRALQVGRVLQVRGSAAPATAPVPTTLPEPAVDAQLPAAAPEAVALPAETEGPVEIRVVNSEPVELVPESPEIPEADFGDVVDVPVVRMQE